MDGRRERAIISGASTPSLARHVRLQFDPVRDAWAVLSPERIFWPNEIGLDILRRLDGHRDVGAITRDLAAEYDAEPDEVAADVVAFLQEWSDRLLVVSSMSPESGDRFRDKDMRRNKGLRHGSESERSRRAFTNEALLPPIAMLAELTHRCPLQCPYCSNPTELLKADRELGTDAWLALFEQAADLGVLQVHLSGGEPTLRRDLETLIAALAGRRVYTNLITSGIGLADTRIASLAEAGLDHVQLSIQGAHATAADHIAHMDGAHAKKLETARQIQAAGLPLTVNAPIHRHNIDQIPEIIELALSMGAERLEIASVQYAGWALVNRDRLMPDRDAVERQIEIVEAAQERLRGIMNIDFVAPDYFATYPKPCMGGWARDAFVVAPDGAVMPCHAAQTIPWLTFDRFGEQGLAEIWANSPAFNAFRGTAWMQEPCRSCERREIDWGGCRCQAMAIAGDAAATDPACIKSPLHGRMARLIEAMQPGSSSDRDEGIAPDGFLYRRIGAHQQRSRDRDRKALT